MSSWNYRLVLVDPEWLVLKEIYYDDEGKPNGYTEIELAGDSREDIVEQLETMLADAKDQPILAWDDIKGSR